MFDVTFCTFTFETMVSFCDRGSRYLSILKGGNTLDVQSLQQRKVSSVSDYLWFGSQKVPTVFGHFLYTHHAL